MNIVLILISIFLNSTAQLLMRRGMLLVGNVEIYNLQKSLAQMVTNFYLWVALLCLGISFFVWMLALSRVEVSYALPFHSLSFVIIAIAGYFFFNENISVLRIVGILIVCIGVYFISKS